MSRLEAIEELLGRIRKNSATLSEYHRTRFNALKGVGFYFDIPILVISAVSSSFAVGAQHYLDQKLISAVSCGAGIVVSIITSIKLYLNISQSMMNEYTCSQAHYVLSIDIFRFLSLAPEDRGMDPTDYLNKQFAKYQKLVESSELLRQRFRLDMLAHPVSVEDWSAKGDDTNSETSDPVTPRKSYLPPEEKNDHLGIDTGNDEAV